MWRHDEGLRVALFVALRELAPRIPISFAALRKHCIRHDYTLRMVRTMESRGQETLALSKADAAKVKRYYLFRLPAVKRF